MKWYRRRVTAVVVMLLLICISILMGSHRTLLSMYQEVEQTFYTGASDSGTGIQDELNIRVDRSYEMKLIGDKYCSGEDTKFVDSLLAARERLQKAETPHEKYQANVALKLSVEELYARLQELNISHMDLQNFDKFYSAFQEAEKHIQNSGYNQIVMEFNNKLKRFPANLLSRITGIHEAEFYQ
jgi:hypothetical protein